MERWAATLDVIIWLDAPDALLAHRIRSREGSHPRAHLPDDLLYEFFAQWRAGYQHVISELTANHGPQVIKLATDQESMDQIADKVLIGLNGRLPGS